MQHSLKYREYLPEARRIVVKIGSRVIVQKSGRPDIIRIKELVKQVAGLRREGYEVVLVSSGAIAAGMEALGIEQRPDTVPKQQMAAAVGQTRLMSRYSEFFAKEKIKVGQVLLTRSDFNHKIRLANARRTLGHLLRAGVMPIVNENDVVADEEIRADLTLGDNDYLAALVVKLVRADLMVMLTTVDGLREPGVKGRTRRVKYVEQIGRKTFALVSPDTNALSKGGMASKLRAAQMASRTGCFVVIANGRQNGVLSDTVSGKDVGTLVLASGV